MNATTTFETRHAARYVAVLCEHFSSRVTATFDDQAGQVVFPFGTCDLAVGSAALAITATAEDAGRLEQVIDLITRHLELFAFRENPNLEWHRPLEASPTR